MYLYVCVYVRMYIYACIYCVRVYMCVYIYIHICTNLCVYYVYVSYVSMYTTAYYRVSEVFVLFNSVRDKNCLATETTILLIGYFKLY